MKPLCVESSNNIPNSSLSYNKTNYIPNNNINTNNINTYYYSPQTQLKYQEEPYKMANINTINLNNEIHYTFILKSNTNTNNINNNSCDLLFASSSRIKSKSHLSMTIKHSNTFDKIINKNAKNNTNNNNTRNKNITNTSRILKSSKQLVYDLLVNSNKNTNNSNDTNTNNMNESSKKRKTNNLIVLNEEEVSTTDTCCKNNTKNIKINNNSSSSSHVVINTEETISSEDSINNSNDNTNNIENIENEICNIINKNLISNTNPINIDPYSFYKTTLNKYYVDMSYNNAFYYENYLENNLKVINSLQYFFKTNEYLNIVEDIKTKLIKDNNNKSHINTNNKPLLLLDLDETLIHSEIYTNQINYDHKFSINCSTSSNTPNITTETIVIWTRPNLHKFLTALSSKYNLGLYTASNKQYAEAILNKINIQHFFEIQLYREHCILIHETFYIKDLRILEKEGQNNIDRIFLIDNSLYSFANNLNNGILVYSFYHDSEDDELLQLNSYLEDLASSCNPLETNIETFNLEQIMTCIDDNDNEEEQELLKSVELEN